jgi:sn-glycerol 3-phosphate transport system permease protein
VRIIPTFKVVSDLHLINTFRASPFPDPHTATLLFRRFFATIPDSWWAAKIDRAPSASSAILLPLSRTNIAALFVILFLTAEPVLPLLIGPAAWTPSSSASPDDRRQRRQTDWNLIVSPHARRCRGASSCSWRWFVGPGGDRNERACCWRWGWSR